MGARVRQGPGVDGLNCGSGFFSMVSVDELGRRGPIGGGGVEVVVDAGYLVAQELGQFGAEVLRGGDAGGAGYKGGEFFHDCGDLCAAVGAGIDADCERGAFGSLDLLVVASEGGVVCSGILVILSSSVY